MSKSKNTLLAKFLITILILNIAHAIGASPKPTVDPSPGKGIEDFDWINASVGVNAPEFYRYGENYTEWIESISGGATDHGDLTGLGDDDHPQYLEASDLNETTDKIASTFLLLTDDTTYTAYHGDNGTVAYSSTNASYVFQSAVDIGGGLIRFRGRWPFNVELVLSGSGISTPEDQIIIRGEGRSSVITQTNDAKRIIVVKNRMVFGLYDLKIEVPITNTEIALHLSDEGGLTEGSCKYSLIDNVWIKGGEGTSPLAHFENIGHGLTVGFLKIQAPNGDALWISNPSPTNNYGNSDFGHLELTASQVDGTALTVYSPDQNIEATLMTFHHFDNSVGGKTSIKIINSKRLKFEWVTLEFFDCAVNVTGYAGKKSSQILIENGYIGVRAGAQAFNVEYSESCYFRALVYGDIGAGLIVNKGYNDKAPNTFELDLRGSYSPYVAGDFNINTAVSAPIMELNDQSLQRTPNWTMVTGVSDGEAILHGVGMTPTVYFAMATVSGEFATITSVNSTHAIIDLKKHDGSSGTTQTVAFYRGWYP